MTSKGISIGGGDSDEDTFQAVPMAHASNTVEISAN